MLWPLKCNFWFPGLAGIPNLRPLTAKKLKDMSLITALIAELKYESVNTRKMLERLPQAQFNWQPHEKSMSLVQLAAHIAEIPGMFVAQAINDVELDFATAKYSQPAIETTAALLAFFEDNINRALAALEATSEEALGQVWTMRQGDTIFAAMPRKVVIRTLGLSHLIHHRGQLSVYLRLAGLAVPGMYGPSADDTF
jgi:uncharacterized damage-inducible protein DinB